MSSDTHDGHLGRMTAQEEKTCGYTRPPLHDSVAKRATPHIFARIRLDRKDLV